MRSVSLRPRDWLGLLLLAFLMGEAHELAHLSVGRLACGDWVGVSFSVVQWPARCPSDTGLALASTAAGPAFTFLLIWIGVVLLPSARWARAGYCLVLANLPFARLFTALTGHGDEVVVGRALGGHTGVLIAMAIVILQAVPPMIAIWLATPRQGRALTVLGGLLGLMLAQGALTMAFLDRILPHLPSATLAGVPVVVWLVNASAAVFFFAAGFHRLLQPEAPTAGIEPVPATA